MEMKQVKTQDIQGKALDYLVAKCEGLKTETWHTGAITVLFPDAPRFVAFNPSTNWGHGGPIIEREGLCVGRRQQADPAYCPLNDPRTICWARTTPGGYLSYGPTPLIAAMRCYIASKMGDVVDVPASLL